MKLSIIIVNYNVRYYLDNCLRSVQKAMAGIDAEVIVVDNASSDDSRQMMESRYPDLEFIPLDENVGFSKGNNVGIARSKGEYILLLNPDTVVQESTFRNCIAYLDQHAEVGGLGVRMIDGSGRFLPESKRGLPTPAAAFYKMFGLSGLFPKSRVFNKYHVGFLSPHETHDVEILSGAFMMLRKDCLDKVGLLDEEYFMYGEDIDLSYRIVQGGYRNHYFAGTTIIHYKGESTKKHSVNYVFVFYRAMLVFARKHFEKGSASLFSFLVNLAIYFRAFLSLMYRLLGRYWQFLLEFAIVYAVFSISTSVYEVYAHKDFSLPFISILLPVYSFVLAVVLHYSGAHDQPFRIVRLLRGWIVGFALLLAFYALLPEGYRFSRAVVVFGSLIALSVGILWRLVLGSLSGTGFLIGPNEIKRRIVVGSLDSLQKVRTTITETQLSDEFIGGISSDTERKEGLIAGFPSLWDAVRDFKVSEVILDTDVCSYKQCIDTVDIASTKGIEVKFYNDGWMIGPGKVIYPHWTEIGNKLRDFREGNFRRTKRTFDIFFALLCLILTPLMMIFADSKLGLLRNCFKVLFGRLTWVGYDPRGMDSALPKLKQGVIYPSMHMIWPEASKEPAFKSNARYVLNYHSFRDLSLIFRHIHSLGDERNGF